MKLLIVLIVIAVVLWFWRRSVRISAAQQQQLRQRRPQISVPEPMVRCTQCGTHLPSAYATFDSQGHPFCCPQHKHLLEK